MFAQIFHIWTFWTFRVNPGYPFFSRVNDYYFRNVNVLLFAQYLVSSFLIAAHLQPLPGGRAEAEQSLRTGFRGRSASRSQVESALLLELQTGRSSASLTWLQCRRFSTLRPNTFPTRCFCIKHPPPSWSPSLLSAGGPSLKHAVQSTQ